MVQAVTRGTIMIEMKSDTNIQLPIDVLSEKPPFDMHEEIAHVKDKTKNSVLDGSFRSFQN